MRITCTSVFVMTLLLGWCFFGWFGDFNMYVDYPNGTSWIKQHATFGDHVVFGFIIALIFALVDTSALWAWQRIRTRRQRLQSAVGGGTLSSHEHAA